MKVNSAILLFVSRSKSLPVLPAASERSLTISPSSKMCGSASKMVSGLKRLGFEEFPEFYSLEYGCYHWLYRPTRSKSRARLVAALKRAGFSAWEPS